ncbi:GNAT family N-acetyltransferase [Hydrogenophaga sp.]|uniref:GNAT family N-acetyltransferase n=1 Tax=Hydrogenophaga sp. TaxID=1904254 RepID=UPI0027208971|nr:GNAT family N-acetyltransferase [Hydrogenophaga sp.]MDO8904577.1 GNAT family N-acetyltransferase [Hydrogenophaga sp.]
MEVPSGSWNELLKHEADPSPFMKHEYLAALHLSGSAGPDAGWQAQFMTLWQGERLCAACAMYLKNHSYGEYVFDWAWANAYDQHGLAYYPKALVAVPFTPVPGARLLAVDAHARSALVQALVEHASRENLSSLHLLFLQAEDASVCKANGLMLRHTVQFHWQNAGTGLESLSTDESDAHDVKAAPHAEHAFIAGSCRYASFGHFLDSLQQEKRKKIRQERRKVAEAGVSFRWSLGRDIEKADWHFFYRCYERTYLEHGNAPYLNRDFFDRMSQTMSENWLLFVAEQAGQPIACSLIAIDPVLGVAYGRYWGALARVDCLHFEACYYQPIAWCIEHGYIRFEGGAQGEHKMARALLPVKTTSAHWLAHPSFADAVERFLAREGEGVDQYVRHLEARSPVKRASLAPRQMPGSGSQNG